MDSIINEPWFSDIRRPGRYLGNEINAVRKDPLNVEVTMALAFPDVYEVGMSHLGLKILYHILNRHAWISAERVFAPWVDLEPYLRQTKRPLTSLETETPLADFDILGFSLQHELCYTNVLNMLDLSGIPLFSAERTDDHPLIVAGGPACFNPEPVAPFLDAVVIGDGEEVAPAICRVVREAKKTHMASRQAILSRLRRIKGVYLPGGFSVKYRPDGTLKRIVPRFPDHTSVEKAIVPDLESHPYPECQVVPIPALVHDRLSIEIARGCTRGCRFCQAGMIYRPVRERSFDSILKHAESALRCTGYEELSLLSLSSGDYSNIQALLKALMDRYADQRTAISLPSLRIDSFSPSWLQQIKRVRKTGFTLAPEAGNERLRKIINKGLTQTDILNMAKEIYGAGWNLIKLYFMVGLPFEEEQDLLDLVRLSREIAGLAGGKGKKARLHVSVATFVPKSHTPFMWRPQISLEESHRRIRFVRTKLKEARIKVKWNQPEMSWLEGIFSRGDRNLSRAVLEAWKQGARYDAWTEQFQWETWKEAFRRTGIDPAFYLYRERSTDEVLPWDHISCGVHKTYLKAEWERAVNEQLTPDCRERCNLCGVCDLDTIKPVLSPAQTTSRGPKLPQKTIAPVQKKFRIFFTKTGTARYIGHLELNRVFIRAFKRAGTPLSYSKGFHPMPKISFAKALGVGIESLDETLDIEVVGALCAVNLKASMDVQLPEGIQITRIEDLPPGSKKPKLQEIHYVIRLNGVVLNSEALGTFMGCADFPVSLDKGAGLKKVINLRSRVRSLECPGPHEIRMVLHHSDGPEFKPVEILAHVFSLDPARLKPIEIVKTRQVLA